jgi:hypothetical protein
MGNTAALSVAIAGAVALGAGLGTGQRAAAADLYDLSDEGRLASVSAEGFVGRPQPTDGPGTFCDGMRLDSGELLGQPSVPIRKAVAR